MVVVVVEERYGLQRCSAGVCVLEQKGSRSGGRRQRAVLSDAEVRDVAYCLYKATLCMADWLAKVEARLGVWAGLIRGKQQS